MRRFLVFAAFAFLLVVGKAAKENGQKPTFAFGPPLGKSGEGLKGWRLSGDAMTVRDFVQLVPPSPNKVGQLWLESSLKSDEFEVEVSYEFKGGDKSNTEGFAIWYDYEGFKAPQDRGLHGYRSNFHGLGVFVAISDRAGMFNPSISAAVSDGKKFWNSKTEIPTNAGVYWKVRNGGPMLLRVTAGPNHIVGQARFGTVSTWTEVFKINAKLQPGGYLGFTAASSRGNTGGLDDVVTVHSAKVFLKGDAIKGMEEGGVDLELKAAAKDDSPLMTLLKAPEANEGTLLNAVRQSNKLLYRYALESVERQRRLADALEAVVGQLQMLTQQTVEMQRQLDGMTGSDHSGMIQRELQGLKSLFHINTQQQQQVAENIMKIATDDGESRRLSPCSGLEAKLEQQASHITFSTWAAAGGLVIVVMASGLIWKKMRDMEKKHYL